VTNDNNSSRATEALLDTIPVSPALLAQAAKFLKDNGVDRPRRPGNQTDRLAGELEKFEQEFGGNVVGFPQK
jgi:hypothetical protein